MAMNNPKGRANYEPNSWVNEGGPRENPSLGFKSFAALVEGPKARVRSSTFSDHYSQARLFYKSQQPIEQKHLGDALVFELSKCVRTDIRSRAVSHLRNIDEQLAATVADGLGLPLPKPAIAAQPTQDLEPSPALSIVGNGPTSFKGRKLGILLTNGSDAKLYNALITAVQKAGAVFAVVAPKIGGVKLDDGSLVAADQKIDGGPSVLFDAVAILPSSDGAALLARDATAKDFVSDAFAHCKFIGFSDGASELFQAARLPAELDEGFIPLSSAKEIESFVQILKQLRVWSRELMVDLGAMKVT